MTISTRKKKSSASITKRLLRMLRVNVAAPGKPPRYEFFVRSRGNGGSGGGNVPEAALLANLPRAGG